MNYWENSINQPTLTECGRNVMNTDSIQFNALQDNCPARKTAFVKLLMLNWIVLYGSGVWVIMPIRKRESING